jgi:hypothetical protein
MFFGFAAELYAEEQDPNEFDDLTSLSLEELMNWLRKQKSHCSKHQPLPMW